MGFEDLIEAVGSEESISRSIESSPLPLLIVAKTNQLVTLNKDAARLLTIPIEKAKGLPLDSLVTILADRTDGAKLCETNTQGKDGINKRLLLYKKPLQSSAIKDYYIITLVDITSYEESKEASEKKLRQYHRYLDLAHVLLVGLSPKGQIIYLNEYGSKLLGKKPSELIGENWIDHFIPSEDREEIRSLLKRYKNGSFPNESYYENYILLKDGERRLFSWRNYTITDEDGSLLGFMASGRDITNQKIIENQNEENNRLLKTLLNSLPGLAYRCRDDKNWTFEYASDGARKLLGCSPNDLIGNEKHTYNEFIHVQDREYVRSQITQALKNKNSFNTNYRIVTTFNKIKWVREHGKGVYDKKGKLLFIEGFIIDDTERKNAGDELEKAKEDYKILVENQTEMIVKVDLEGRFLYVSPSYCKLFGKEKKELIGRKIYPDIHPEDREGTQQALLKVTSAPHTVYHEIRALTLNGYRWMAWSAKAIFDKEGNITAVVGTGKDINEKKITEQAKQANEEKFTSLVLSMNEGVSIHKLLRDKKGKAIDYLITDTNNAYHRILGLKKEDVIGKKATAVYKQKKAPYLSLYEEIVRTKKPQLFETYFAPMEKTFNISAFCVAEDTFVTIFRDITNQKKDGELLEQSEKRYRTLFEQANDAIFILYDDRFIDCNEKTLEIYQVPSKKELLGKKIQDFSPPNQTGGRNSAELMKEYLDATLQGKPQRFEWLHINNKAESFYVEISLSRFPFDSKHLLQAVVRDITARKETEKIISASREQLRNIIDSATDLIIAVDEQMKITAWNNATKQFTGVSAKQAIGVSIDDQQLPKSIQPLTNLLKKSFEKTKTGYEELLLQDESGNHYTLLVGISLVKDYDGSITGAVLTAKDVTEQKDLRKGLQEGKSYYAEQPCEALFRTFLEPSSTNPSQFLCIRRPNDNFPMNLPPNTKTILLASADYQQEEDEHPKTDDVEELLKLIEKQTKNENKTLIFLDRIDYLIMTNGFEKVTRFIYRINDRLNNTKNLLIVRIDKETMDQQQQKFITNETNPFPKNYSETEHLEEDRLKILRYIANKNEHRAKVSYSVISTVFNLARMTTKKYLDELILKNLLRVEKEGRSKFIYLTAKGRKILEGE